MKHLLFTLLFLFPRLLFAADNASLSFSPATAAYSIGNTFTVSVKVDTGGQTINAVEGKISFNKEELGVESISKDASIVESWATEPVYSAADEAISFGGGMKSFAGGNGNIFSITFRSLKNTEAKVRFSTGAAILAADGQGTNILTVMNAGAYTLAPKEVIPAAEPSLVKGLVLGVSTSSEQKIVITSVTHPDENIWHNEKTAKFEWALPPDATALRWSVNAASSSLPTKPSPLIHEKIIRDIDEGVSYFHLQIKTTLGWGEPAAYRFQTDTEKPDTFHISQVTTPSTFGFLFDAHDKTSGIEKYLLQIDGGAESEWRDDGSHKYFLSDEKPGAHTLFAKAVDFAGNTATSSILFSLDPISPPTITDFKPELTLGDALVIRGKADPNINLSVWVEKDGTKAAENKLASENDGGFTFVLPGNSEEGVYKIYAEEVGRGARSAPSASVLVAVRKPTLILFGNAAVSYLSILIPLATLILLLLFILVYGWHRFKMFRAKLWTEVEKVEEASRESFSALREEINEDERILDSISAPKRKSKEAATEEKEIIQRLRKSVDAAEEKVEKEISIAKEKVKKSVKLKIKKMD